MEGLERFKEEVVRVVFVEAGQEQVQKGKVTGIDENFIYLETFTNFYAIGLKDIVKVKTVRGQEGQG